MKFLFSASERSKIELVKKKLVLAGIACEVYQRSEVDPRGIPSYPELWVQKEEDYRSAAMLLSRIAALRG